MSRVELHGIGKHFGGHAAVQDVHLVAEPGQFVALLGPSGCGKSTTLRLIAALEQPDAGRIVIGGVDVTHAPAAERGIAMVFQNYALFPHLTVGENIVFGLTVRRVDKAERARRLAQAAELLGLQALLGRKPAQLSGGQRQRVALGRAIVAQAPVCLMDEPLSNLDAQLRQQMRGEIRELQQRLGITMVYVTHDQTEAMTMADRVVLMRAGHIEQQGTPQDLYERPASAFVAGFIGAPAMNLFPAPDGSAAVWGVRPEQMQLRPVHEGLAATVQAVEYLGAESLLICETASSARVVLRAGGHALPRRGDAVGLDWPASALHRFDRASGLRLSQP
ncbi:MAG: ABC transporter ATP-binding protein [Hydrogenophaga sp.]|uniref:ABC transporter ATP-binding protein n=1 Tax=Hydrogenophaga sp. TaxID=1904254 RepID=UPI002607E897|nr:ABC transporter ATP-binding protein [Hydrogenophaga sp.]MCV0437611.1 ABC transporter ATP-binding protein [Hydrogenophaga sp.]